MIREATPRDTVEQLYYAFMAIYGASDKAGSKAYAHQLMENDVTLLGHYFGTVDPLGEMAEFTLLAECIAYIRLLDSPVSVNQMLDPYIERIIREFGGRDFNTVTIEPQSPPEDVVRSLKCLQFSRDLLDRGVISAAQDRSLRDRFARLADFFLLRDGNVTDKELQAIRSFEQALVKRF